MLRGKNNYLKFYRSLSTGSQPPKPQSIGKFIIFPTLVFGTTCGLAYLREHDKIPNETINKQLEFLEPIQNFLRLKGFGKVAIPTIPTSSQDHETSDATEIIEEGHEIHHEDVSAPHGIIEEEPKSDIEATFEVIEKKSSNEDLTAEHVSDLPPVSIADESVVSDNIHQSEPTTTAPHLAEVVPETASLQDRSNSPIPIPAPTSVSAATQSTEPTTSSNQFLNLRVATLDHILEDVAKQTAELKLETEQALFRDLENLDESALRYRILQLSAEVFDRIKWEGLRQQQVLREAELTFAQNYGQLLSDQKAELTLTLEKKLLEKEKELLLEHQKKIDDLSASYEQRLVAALSSQALQLTNSTKSEVEKSENLLRTQLQNEFNHQMAMLKQEHVKRSLLAQEAVIEQTVQLEQFNNLITTELQKTNISAHTHGLSAAVLLIENALLSGTPVNREIAAIKKHAQDDELILLLISTLPKCATTTGVPTLATIRSRFHVVKDEVRKAGLAPENAPPLLGQMIGNLLASISIEPSKPIDGEGIEAVLSRTYGYVEDGQLDLALKEVQTIQGYPRILLSDWEEMLTNRLIAEQATKGLRAVTALKHLQFV